MAFDKKLQALRKQHHMSQEELAGRLGTTRNTVSRWETSQSMPEGDKLLLISELFGISTDYLLKDKPDDVSISEASGYNTQRTLFWVCSTINLTGLVMSMFGWHELQSPFFVVTGMLMNLLACVFFEVFHPKEIAKRIVWYARKRFYAANVWMLLPMPMYIATEMMFGQEYHDTIAPHLLPGVLYILAAAGITACLLSQRRK